MDNKWLAPLGSATWDKGDRQSVKGLHMRVGKDGSRSWLFYYRTKTGKQRRPKIGDADKITLGQARDLARAMAAQVTLGEDPQAKVESARVKNAEAKAVEKAMPTVEDLFNLAFTTHWNSERFQKSKRTKTVEQVYNRSLKETFGKVRYDKLTPGMIRAWKMRFESKPYEANRALEVLSFIYNLAEKDRVIPRHTNPCVDVEPYPERKRGRYATADELAKIWAELDKEELFNPAGAAFLKLILLTGSRPFALLNARLDQFRVIIKNEKRFGILVAAGKSTAETGEEETVIFPPDAMAIVDRLPQTYDGRLFRCSYPADMWNRVRAKVGCVDLRIRDSRRTFATQGLSGGVNLSVIGELLNHSNTDQTRTYAKLMPLARMEAAEQISGSISRITGDKAT